MFPDLTVSALILGAATAVGFLFDSLGFSASNVITVYILGILAVSAVTASRLWSLIASALSVLAFNFLFTAPRYTLQADGKDYPVTFITMFLAALLTGTLANRLKRQARESAQAAVLAKQEQMRANLLRSISHDLRTPLTSISGNASNLISNSREFDEETKQQIYHDIYEDSLWLINLVENILAVTRIEDGRMNLRVSTELMDEVITEALRHVNRRGKELSIDYDDGGELILAKIDARLIVQVIINLVDNAVKYTPPGSHILIRAKKTGDMVTVTVSDDGPGIPDDQKLKIFELFYSGANKAADSRRSMGLGLALCRTIVTAHGGEITVSDRVPRGTTFTFTLPSGEVELHE